MYRKSAIAAALFFITASSNLHALGLGEIDMQSALNQPMNAAIELTSAAGADLSMVTVTLASQADHQRIGLSRSKILNDFDFSIETDKRGNAVIRITSRGTIHEPFLEFLLELTWPNGHLFRQYTVLVDPPVTMPATPARPATPVSRAAASPAVVQPQQYRASRPAPAAVRPATPATAATADSYGPIRRNETLWSIAEKLRPGTDISMHQMMLALQRENPQAFEDGNINNLNAGATLKVPSRNEILSMSASQAYAETRRQYDEWNARSQPAEPVQENAVVAETDVAPETVVTTKSRLQLMAPDIEAVDGTATSGDPVEATPESSESGTERLNQQLALATEEAETSKAQSAEYQSQVTELEDQIETMKRLLVLKDEELASMQQRLSAGIDDEAVAAGEAASEEAAQETLPVETAATALVDEEAPVMDEPADEPGGIVNQLMDNPLLAGLGVLVALLLGGFLWSSTRKRNHTGIFDDEVTLQGQMAEAATGSRQGRSPPVFDVNETQPGQQAEAASEPANDESDPLTEADVYLAYGRIQQAEDVLQAALANSPQDSAIRLKLLEVYHAAGNVAAFDREASNFRDGVTEEDAVWMQVASMGHAMSPGNELYRAAAMHTDAAHADHDTEHPEMESPEDQQHPGHGMDTGAESELPESIEYTLDEVVETAAAEDAFDEEDASEGLLSTADEVTTKLDLARAYLDMGDPEGARSILGEVLEEGNDQQKDEAEALISKLA
ncbi:MAG: FimV/HubP family polar landmark protein [Gammaproteobacteria bacterium]